MRVLEYCQVCFIQYFAYCKFYTDWVLTSTVFFCHSTLKLSIKILRFCLIENQQWILSIVILINIVRRYDSLSWWNNYDIFLWITIDLLDCISKIKNFFSFNHFFLSLLDWNNMKNYLFRNQKHHLFYRKPIELVFRWISCLMCI